MVTVRIPDDLRNRIDAARPSTTSREAWVRAACERVLQIDGHGHRPPPVAAAPSHENGAEEQAKPMPAFTTVADPDSHGDVIRVLHRSNCKCMSCKPPKGKP